MRAVMMAFILASSATGAATAQGLYDDQNRFPAQQRMSELAQRDHQYRPWDLQAAEAREDTELRLNGLAEQQQATNDALASASIEAGEQIEAQIEADGGRIDQLMDAALARGNARILAVKPVTR